MVALYLCSIVAANLLVAALGAAYAPLTAFLFIGLDLTCRDKLHERWSGAGLRKKMAALILAGTVISYVANPAAGRVAFGSMVAWLCSATIDTLVYDGLRKSGLSKKTSANRSNVVSAPVDSGVFLPIAFGALPVWVFFGQVCAKVFGGWLWSLFLFRNETD